MPRVRIYQPAKTAMQSGWANTRRWIMEFEPEGREHHDPLMGWISSADTKGQVRLTFDSDQEAIAYAQRQGYEFSLAEPQARRTKPKSYADNFKWNRVN